MKFLNFFVFVSFFCNLSWGVNSESTLVVNEIQRVSFIQDSTFFDLKNNSRFAVYTVGQKWIFANGILSLFYTSTASSSSFSSSEMSSSLAASSSSFSSSEMSSSLAVSSSSFSSSEMSSSLAASSSSFSSSEMSSSLAASSSSFSSSEMSSSLAASSSSFSLSEMSSSLAVSSSSEITVTAITRFQDVISIKTSIGDKVILRNINGQVLEERVVKEIESKVQIPPNGIYLLQVYNEFLGKTYLIQRQ